LVYPASFTCFDNLQWAIPVDQVDKMRNWYSLWSKAGASPTFRVENPEIYLSNFNWLSQWLKFYFFSKVTDTVFVIFLISIISLCVFRVGKKNHIYNYNKDYKLLFVALIILFAEWFVNHPTLRYGGYTFFALMFFVPLSFFLEKRTVCNQKFKKKVSILIVAAFSIFIIKNVSRLHSENTKYGYNILTNPYFHVNENNFVFQKILRTLDLKYKKNNDSFYLILDYKLINNK
jgi:hypothetical protein